MRVVRVIFSDIYMNAINGIPMDLFKDIMSKFPLDARVVNFGNDFTRAYSYILVSSDAFDDVPEDGLPPDAIVCIHRLPNGTEICDSVEWNNKTYNPAKICSHDWKTYMGLTESFEYCSICGEKA